MISAVIMNELRSNFLSLRFPMALLIILIVFGTGTISSIEDQKTRMREYEKFQSELRVNTREAAANISVLAVSMQDYILKPRGDAFITGSKEKVIPNSITYNAFNVFGFETRRGNTNPYINPFEEISWGFIVSIILSFTIFLFTYDSISGEKEDRTLAVSLSNSISRGTLLFGKYFATILTALFILLPGICLSLGIIFISGGTDLSPIIPLEVSGFILVSVVFISCITAFGLFSSVLAKRSDVSLLVALILWVLFVEIVPNSAIYLSQTLYPIDTADTIQKKIQSAKEIIEKNAPAGRWNEFDSQPFLPFHKIRAAHQMNLMSGEMRIRNAYYRDMFHQIERARLLTFVSPVSLYEYLCEAVVGGGYSRFRTVWKDIHAFQAQFLTFFKAKDALDPGSPHWFNPYESIATSRKPVNPGELPVFTEKRASFEDRISFGGIYMVSLLLITAIVLYVTFILFVRYDVR